MNQTRVLVFVMRKEVARSDDVSDVDDVDLECRWHSSYSSADRSHREAAEKVIGAGKIGAAKFRNNRLTLDMTPRCREMKSKN